MGDIRHLMGNNAPAGSSRIDSVNADSVNSIVERIAGVNPSKLAQQVTGERIQEGPADGGAFGGAPMSGTPLQYTAAQSNPYAQQPYASQPASQGVDPQAMARMQQLYERVQMLEQKVAYYESGNTVVGYDPNRGQGNDNEAWSPKMNPKKKNKKDPIDGIPDDAADTSAEEARMSLDPLAELGLSMTECLDLAGVLEGSEPRRKPQTPPASHAVPLSEEYEAEELTEEDRDELWEMFLEQRGLTLGDLDALVDDALARDDEETMEMVLALEDQFHELLGGVGQALGGLAKQAVTKLDTAGQKIGQAAVGGVKKAAKAVATAPLKAAGMMKPKAPVQQPLVPALPAQPPAPTPQAAAPAAAAPAQAPQPAPAAGAMKSTVKPASPAPKTKPQITARKESVESFEFETDAGPDGMPHNIPWERILKAYRVKQAPSPSDTSTGMDATDTAELRGFGSQNQV